MELSPVIEIPIQVKDKIFQKDTYDAKLIEKLIQEKKIRPLPVKKPQIYAIMSQFRLDEGEAAAYILFDKKRHKALLTDDGELIKLCKLEGVPFACAMAIIIRLFEKKKLSKEETLRKLEELHTIGRYSKELYEHFKAEVG